MLTRNIQPFSLEVIRPTPTLFNFKQYEAAKVEAQLPHIPTGLL